MKKSLISILCTVLMISGGKAAFAAANPFSDVPAGHWAYDAVSQLAADGILEGYGDSTFRGSRELTRYEMAQMVAKAMTQHPSGTDAELLERLTSEFSDELHNLGVRIADLEQHSDRMQWHGFLRYTSMNIRRDNAKLNPQPLLLRIEPQMTVTDHWKLHARLDSTILMDQDNTTDIHLQRIWAEGTYGDFTVKLGRIPNMTEFDHYMMFFGQFAGVEADFDRGLFRAQLRAGRIGLENVRYWNGTLYGGVLRPQSDQAADFQNAVLSYAPGKLSLTGAYYHLNADWFRNTNYSADGSTDDAHIWEAAGTYRFNPYIAFTAAYARNTSADYYAHSHIFQLSYRGARLKHPGSWGFYTAYRYLGGNTSVDPVTAGALDNARSWEVGGAYIPMKHVLLRAIYADGKDLPTNGKARNVFFRCEWYF